MHNQAWNGYLAAAQTMLTGSPGDPCDYGTCTAIPATQVYKFTMQFEMTKAEFEAVQDDYITGVANVAGVPASYVTVVVTENPERRRLLATTVDVETTIKAASADQLSSVTEALSNQDGLKAALVSQNADLVGTITATSDENGSSGARHLSASAALMALGFLATRTVAW